MTWKGHETRMFNTFGWLKTPFFLENTMKLARKSKNRRLIWSKDFFCLHPRIPDNSLPKTFLGSLPMSVRNSAYSDIATLCLFVFSNCYFSGDCRDFACGSCKQGISKQIGLQFDFACGSKRFGQDRTIAHCKGSQAKLLVSIVSDLAAFQPKIKKVCLKSIAS